MSFYGLQAELPNGKPYPFTELRGKVVLIVNVSTVCLFTPQFDGLQALYEKHKDKGFVVLGFPSNQFNSSTEGDAAIGETCRLNHGVTFPLMKTSDVNGDNANQVFSYLKKQQSSWGLARIKWNFEKFLVDREGNVVNRWLSSTQLEAMEADILKALG